MAAYTFKEEKVRKTLNKNQEWLKNINSLIRTRSGNPTEVARLQVAKADVESRLTQDEIKECYEGTGGLSQAEKDAIWAAEMAEMEHNKDSNSI